MRTEIVFAEYVHEDRHVKYRYAWESSFPDNAKNLLRRVNPVLKKYMEDTGEPLPIVVSGWRPPEINKLAGGSKNSWHLRARAIDLQDDPESQKLGNYLVKNVQLLEAYGLAMEDPRATLKRVNGVLQAWVHLQDPLPKSGRRVFIP